jgi:hypothetical protein
MVRLVLGLATCALVLLGVYHTMKPRGVAGRAETGAATGPATAGAMVRDMRKIEAANRAAMDRTLNAAK